MYRFSSGRPATGICGKPDPNELSIDVAEVCDHFNRNLRRNGGSRFFSACGAAIDFSRN
jgi:hypothetical protein